MLNSIKSALGFGETYPSYKPKEPPSKQLRNHPALEVLIALDDAMCICADGSAHIRRELGEEGFRHFDNSHCGSDRGLLWFAQEGWQSYHLDMTSHWKLLARYMDGFRAADLIALKLETMDREKMPPRLRSALARFVAKLPPASA